MSSLKLVPFLLFIGFLAQPGEVSAALPLQQLTDTPAGRQLALWIEAFNTGDRQIVDRYLQQNTTDEFRLQNPTDRQLNDQLYVGRFNVTKIENSTPFRVVALVKAFDTDDTFEVAFTVGEDGTHLATSMSKALHPPSSSIGLGLTDRELERALRARLSTLVREDRFSGTVLLVHRGQVIYSGAYGFSDRSSHRPNTLNTRFRVGSISKAFTAIAILQLAQAGKLKLTDCVGKYLGDYPNKAIGDNVTIDQLLSHTGGTGDFFGPEFYAGHGQLNGINDYLAIDPMRALSFEPGKSTEYSNYGYILLGSVVEHVSGESYYDYVREHIYVPAGMSLSDTLPEDQTVPGRALGYMKPLGTTAWELNTDTLPNMGSSAGGSLSTAGDLLRFSQALMKNELLSPEYTKLDITAKALPDNHGAPFAYGFADLRAPDGSGWFGVNGGAEGMNAQIRIYPKTGYVIAVLSNFDLPAADRVVWFIDRRLMQ